MGRPGANLVILLISQQQNVRILWELKVTQKFAQQK
jgi:hypothetical protein